ncbi:MAG: CHAT domain-containing protein [Desulfomonile tiedjei]|nr:CHAT domain-containing protein [Desulfomonile tiedjei]
MKCLPGRRFAKAFLTFLSIATVALVVVFQTGRNDAFGQEPGGRGQDAGTAGSDSEKTDARGQDDAKSKYRWLFKERVEPQPSPEPDPATILQKLDRQIKEARRLYLAGEIENAILKYRSVLDNLESALGDVPPGDPLLNEIKERFQIFDELATKIMGPAHLEPQEDVSARIFHLMEKRRLCWRNYVLKKAGPIKFLDVSAALLKEEADVLRKMLEVKGEIGSPSTRQEEEALATKLSDVRKSLQKSSPRYAFLRKGLPLTLAEVQRELLGKDELILDFNLLADRMIVGVITNEKATYYQVPTTRGDIERGILHLQDKLREFALGEAATFMGHAWREPARRVYRTLLGKLPPLPADKTRILVIPDGALWYLPFSVMLDTEDRPFGRDRVISLTPSADVVRFLRSSHGKPPAPEFTGDLLLFEAIPWIPEGDARKASSHDQAGQKAPQSEEDKIERLILANPVYPKPSDIVVSIQKIFKKFDVWIGSTATLDKLVQYKGRGDHVAIFAVPLAMTDTVSPERQPTLFFAPDNKARRKLSVSRLFALPTGARLVVLPVSWLDLSGVEIPGGEGPLLLNLALAYSGVKLCLVNYSDQNWGADDPFLLSVLKRIATKGASYEALGAYPREMPAGLDSSFAGKPPSWTGWILMGDPYDARGSAPAAPVAAQQSETR